jgi:nucleoside-diphosphate-sugar epimerase
MGVRNLVDAAKANHVRHFVLVSAGNVGPYRDHTQNPRFGYVAYWKTKGENYLKASEVPFTIVGPSGFTDGPAGALGLRLAPRSEFEMTLIRREDIAVVTAAMLNNPAAFGKAMFIDNNANFDTMSWRAKIADIKPEP